MLLGVFCLLNNRVTLEVLLLKSAYVKDDARYILECLNLDGLTGNMEGKA